MKIAIWIPDIDFARFEGVAAKNGMNRSEFYRRAAERFADELEGEPELTRLANAALLKARVSSDTDEFLRETRRVVGESTEW